MNAAQHNTHTHQTHTPEKTQNEANGNGSDNGARKKEKKRDVGHTLFHLDHLQHAQRPTLPHVARRVGRLTTMTERKGSNLKGSERGRERVQKDRAGECRREFLGESVLDGSKSEGVSDTGRGEK